jgi:hypothetical protein
VEVRLVFFVPMPEPVGHRIRLGRAVLPSPGSETHIATTDITQLVPRPGGWWASWRYAESRVGVCRVKKGCRVVQVVLCLTGVCRSVAQWPARWAGRVARHVALRRMVREERWR